MNHDALFAMYKEELMSGINGAVYSEEEAYKRYKDVKHIAETLGVSVMDAIETMLDTTPVYRVCRE